MSQTPEEIAFEIIKLCSVWGPILAREKIEKLIREALAEMSKPMDCGHPMWATQDIQLHHERSNANVTMPLCSICRDIAEARKKALMDATELVAAALFKFHTVANDHDFANVYKEVVRLLAKEGK